jgi:stage V sporulation protein SpoVS
LATVTQELQDITGAKEHRDQLLSRQTEVAGAKTELMREKEKVEAQQVADTWVERKLHKAASPAGTKGSKSESGCIKR